MSIGHRPTHTYKRKALQYHPDKLKPGDDPDKAAEMFDAVSAPPSDPC